MGRRLDLTGQKYQKFTVLSRAPNTRENDGDSVTRWNCRCECGNEIVVTTVGLRHGKRQSCGCDFLANRAAKRRPTVDRFWEKVKKTDGCWEWIGNKNRAGYGMFLGYDMGHILATRFSWELHYGPRPKHLYVLHKCDNPPCVRPDHLFLGTMSDNTRDSFSKGRSSRFGEHNPSARLTREQVRILYHAMTDFPVYKLRGVFGASKNMLHHIKNGYTWSEVTGAVKTR